MSSAMTVVTVTGVTSYPTAPQVALAFEPRRITIINESADALAPVDYSFDGVNDAGQVLQQRPNESLSHETRNLKVWFKEASGGAFAGAVKVRVLSSR